MITPGADVALYLGPGTHTTHDPAGITINTGHATIRLRWPAALPHEDRAAIAAQAAATLRDAATHQLNIPLQRVES